ncbi:MAG: RusA family crossover junction endodeoxyribonuclease [Synergistaceae bacterium]|nr:RusA family crossover junction endodeoxyribonuclease [Synergistaceae bacterium]
MDSERELLRIELEGLPPSVNHMYMDARRRRFRTLECRNYQDHVVEEIKSRWNKPMFTGRVALKVKLTTNNRRRWDLDNRLKALQDCLEMAEVIKNDSQIDLILISREYTKENSTTLILENLDSSALT